MTDSMTIRKAAGADHPAIWAIIGPAIRLGETLAIDQDICEVDALDYWAGSDRQTFVVEENGRILGTYYIRPNQAGGGAHIANSGFVTAPEFGGKGVARFMCEHAMEFARSCGYRGMQFNFVVSNNESAVRLWQSLEFAIVGRLPAAFHHPRLGFVDALVMFRSLIDGQTDADARSVGSHLVRIAKEME